jgi:hypothetical protein
VACADKAKITGVSVGFFNGAYIVHQGNPDAEFEQGAKRWVHRSASGIIGALAHDRTAYPYKKMPAEVREALLDNLARNGVKMSGLPFLSPEDREKYKALLAQHGHPESYGREWAGYYKDKRRIDGEIVLGGMFNRPLAFVAEATATEDDLVAYADLLGVEHAFIQDDKPGYLFWEKDSPFPPRRVSEILSPTAIETRRFQRKYATPLTSPVADTSVPIEPWQKEAVGAIGAAVESGKRRVTVSAVHQDDHSTTAIAVMQHFHTNLQGQRMLYVAPTPDDAKRFATDCRVHAINELSQVSHRKGEGRSDGGIDVVTYQDLMDGDGENRPVLPSIDAGCYGLVVVSDSVGRERLPKDALAKLDAVQVTLNPFDKFNKSPVVYTAPPQTPTDSIFREFVAKNPVTTVQEYGRSVYLDQSSQGFHDRQSLLRMMKPYLKDGRVPDLHLIKKRGKTHFEYRFGWSEAEKVGGYINDSRDLIVSEFKRRGIALREE